MDETQKLEVSEVLCSWGKAAGVPADAAKALGLCPLFLWGEQEEEDREGGEEGEGRRQLWQQKEKGKKGKEWDFPGRSEVKTLPFPCMGHGFNPWSGN